MVKMNMLSNFYKWKKIGNFQFSCNPEQHMKKNKPFTFAELCK